MNDDFPYRFIIVDAVICYALLEVVLRCACRLLLLRGVRCHLRCTAQYTSVMGQHMF